MTLPDLDPRVSVVVVSHNTRDDLLRCLASLSTIELPHEVVVVDNASTDGSADAVRRAHPAAVLVANEDNRGFARATNQGLLRAQARYALILNSDAEVTAAAVATLAGILDARPDVALVGPRTLSADGTVQVSFGPDLTPRNEWRQRRLVRGVKARQPQALRTLEAMTGSEHEPAWVSGSCMMARLEALAAVGYFDERFFLYEEDVDLCVRLRRAGWRILYTPEASVLHHLGRSMARVPARSWLEYHRSHLLYYRKHRGPVLAALLGLYLAGVAALRVLSSLGAGALGKERRQSGLDLLRIVWWRESR